MVDVRGVAAAVLGIGLGIVFLVFPEAVVRVQTVGRVPHDRTGEYGSDSPPSRWVLLVRIVGVGVLIISLYIGATLVIL